MHESRQRCLRIALVSLACLAAGRGPISIGNGDLLLTLDANHRIAGVYSADSVPQNLDAEPALRLYQYADGWIEELDAGAPGKRKPGDYLSIDVHVFSAASGEPLAALAWVSDGRRPLPPLDVSTVTAGEDGRLRLEAPRSASVRLWAPGHGQLTLSASRLASRRSTVLDAGGVADVELVHQGRPVPELNLRYCLGPLDECRPLTWLAAATDGEGRFAAAGTGPGARLHLEVADSRFAFTAGSFEAGSHRLVLETGAAVRGRTVDGEGTPVAGVEVEALVPVPGDPRAQKRLTARSDEDGRFELAGLPAARSLLGFRHPDFRQVDRRVDFDDRRTVDLETVVLAPGRRAEIVVRGPDGPVTGAVVRDSVTGESFTPRDDGRLVIHGLPLDEARRVEVQADGYLPAAAELTPGAPQPVEVRLERGAGIVVELRDTETGEPVTEARGKLGRGGGFSVVELRDPAGRHRMGGLAPGPWKVELDVPGFLPVALDLELDAGELLDLGTVSLDRGASVQGVLLGPAGIPLAGARVATVRPNVLGNLAARRLGDEHETIADEEGFFLLSGLDGGDLCLTVSHAAVPDTALPAGEAEPFAVTDLGTVLLGRGTAVAGRVHDAAGDPVTDVGVELRAGVLRNPCLWLRSSPDDEGRFLFPRVAAGRYHLLARRRGAVAAVRRLEVPETTGAVEADLAVRDGRLSGTVHRAGRPVDGGSVLIRWRDGGTFSPVPVYFSHQGRGASGGQELISDAPARLYAAVGGDGRYEIRGVLEPGQVRIDYEGADGRQRIVRHAEIPADVESLELDVDVDGRTIRGRTIDEADGEPVAGAAVAVRQGGLLAAETTSDDGGWFEAAGVPPAEVELSAAAGDRRGRAELSLDLDPPEPIELLLRHEASGSVEVRVQDEDGGDFAGALVYLTDRAEIHRFQRTGANGLATFEGLRPDAYRLLVAGPGGGLHDGGSVTVGSAGSVARADVSLTATHRVRLEWDEEKAGRRAELDAADGLSLRPLLTLLGRDAVLDESGSIDLPLAAGPWQVRLPPDAASHRISVEEDGAISLADG